MEALLSFQDALAGVSDASILQNQGCRSLLVTLDHLQETATLVDPKLRQFSDLPEWVLGHAEQLKNRKVMMYCTGGVRCERASAFVKSLGPEFQDVYQLQGSQLLHI